MHLKDRQQGLNQNLCEYDIDGQLITIKVVSDDDPIVKSAARLWYDVYIDEMGFEVAEGVSHSKKVYEPVSNGSLIFIALKDDKVISTLRATYNQLTALEFNYGKYDKYRLFEISKLITHKEFRQGVVTKIIMIQTQFYCRENFEYDGIVINSSEKLLNYYRQLRFDKVDEEKIVHPVLKNNSYLMFCSFEKFDKLADIFNKFTKKHETQAPKF